MKKQLALALMLALIAGCSTTTIKRKGTARLGSDPTYSESKPFFLWGLVGTAEVNIKEVCRGRKARQLQSQYTIGDVLLGLITVGIYQPRTAKFGAIEEGEASDDQKTFKTLGRGDWTCSHDEWVFDHPLCQPG